MRIYRSIDDARQAFDAYARVEPRLGPLWDVCRRAAPPAREPDPVDDTYDDPFELDTIADGKPDEGWCADDYFLDHVKSKLLLLVGLHRASAPIELQSTKAFEEVYDLLLNWALHRPCSCCNTSSNDVDDERDIGGPAHT